MKLADIKDKSVAIKCATKEEMSKVIKILDTYVPWTYKGSLINYSSAFDNKFVFILINKTGAYSNERGEHIQYTPTKILAAKLLEENQFGLSL